MGMIIVNVSLLQVAVIHRASCKDQKQWTGCVENIASVTAGQQLSPCIVVVGEVVASYRPNKSDSSSFSAPVPENKAS
eukprot:scaffold387417_cov45-Prasinocladus_malaysianus.AAC.1